MEAKKFEVGQKWVNRVGQVVEITNVYSGVTGYTIGTDKGPMTIEGRYFLDSKDSEHDLVALFRDGDNQMSNDDADDGGDSLTEQDSIFRDNLILSALPYYAQLEGKWADAMMDNIDTIMRRR